MDDHFAKSLGATWEHVKPRQDELNGGLFSGSVDDHFAKALGDTWYKIKATNEGPRTQPESRSPGHGHASLVQS